MKLCCYCCGEPLGRFFALVTMSANAVDRVFVVKPEHLERLDDTAHSVLVSEVAST